MWLPQWCCWCSRSLLYDPDHVVFWAGVAFMGFLQVTAAVLNLLPVPGLDGYSALEPHLSPETQRALQPAKQWAFFIALLLLIATPLNQYFWSLVDWFVEASGMPRRAGRRPASTSPGSGRPGCRAALATYASLRID